MFYPINNLALFKNNAKLKKKKLVRIGYYDTGSHHDPIVLVQVHDIIFVILTIVIALICVFFSRSLNNNFGNKNRDCFYTT